MVEAIEHSWRVDIHPLKEGHHSGIMRQSISRVNANGITETDGFVMGDAIADIVDEIEFVENVVVIVLNLGRRTRLVGKCPQKHSTCQAIMSVGVEILPNAELHSGQQFGV